MSDQLQQVSSKLEDYRQQYIEFIEIAAHDLQAPLRKLSMLTERLTSRYAPVANGDIQEYVQRINTCIHDMRSLIDSLAELASLNTDKMEPAICNIDSLVKRILYEMRTGLKEKKATMVIAALPEVEGDENQVYHLFKKIIENVIKFAKEYTPLSLGIHSQPLTVEEKNQHKLDADRVYHKIEITDNGVGFKQQFAEKIFHPLVRLNGKSGYPGNGVGLAVCEKIVRNHQGIIYGEGVEHEGARFIIILPEKR